MPFECKAHDLIPDLLDYEVVCGVKLLLYITNLTKASEATSCQQVLV